MVKNWQCLKTLHLCYLRHAERHAKNRNSQRGLDHDTLLNDPLFCRALVVTLMMDYNKFNDSAEISDGMFWHLCN